jgi:hypothetical protein
MQSSIHSSVPSVGDDVVRELRLADQRQSGSPACPLGPTPCSTAVPQSPWSDEIRDRIEMNRQVTEEAEAIWQAQQELLA